MFVVIDVVIFILMFSIKKLGYRYLCSGWVSLLFNSLVVM